MAEINVFNTFSFKKWSERLREKKMDEEIQRQRMEQVTRLRDKLAREREIREKADMLNEDDMERLIQFLNESGAFRAKMVPRGAGVAPAPQQNNSGLFGLFNMPNFVAGTQTKKREKKVQKTSFSYNRRWHDMAQKAAKPEPAAPTRQELYNFEYNRRFGNLV